MSKVLIIGAGGVGSVAVHKCAQVPEVFTEIHLASRTKSKCDAIAASVLTRTGVTVPTYAVDADNVAETVALIKRIKPDLLVNLALPYQDLALMDACLETGVNYLDTANYEPPNEAKFEYKWQWAYQERFRQAGLMALLGSGFDPGVTNVFAAHAMKHHFDEIHVLDIIDCNAGDHGQAFATNFNPEINIREITQRGRYWERGEWVETDPLSWSMSYDFPEGIGTKKCYLMYHEELESLVMHIKGLKRARFWMTFGDQYLTHLRVLEGIGMTSIKPVEFGGQMIQPLQFLKAVLPEPGSLGPLTKGRTCIGNVMKGVKDGREKTLYVYNICSHEAAYAEVGSQAISYTTGVPAMIGAMMLLTGKWSGKGVFHMEQMDPDPFMAALNAHGLPWTEVEL
ncbi:MAG: saccharopine dehydrogenase family protein [Pseudodesulfovibrio sp.]|uniref:Saccharopine dehydrogenase n=1 Tax=Pseudodesulfovibrio aespoeensis (strain ATCC 700646 / DSM 10631 / Aspo-2) TaxID=643562 RepID=E6VRX7_PSEA9|nr:MULTISPECIES: saccharopine dehydrogenase family protein [Pseudodesulfovibrio]MBU4192761.1 saccharopine dehydrogenase family protein [Pseudomonadota bacterium]ADU61910.1 Saccharopine dehydrogenase [Pseudodesulfovibrio aespoeensis Aspo-2]MBU4243632.1 saccharopine dehydrogenase family protein [Pseudomonadota bacterium]MBU4377722.1 saccharopine dehydrogenase family protein [Pseudomonadota bacterium]MBU4475728.1 saccharopine dehydrogenase family protein [Pseudomonadota bacterium]